MSSLASWIDPDEVASIARSLCSPERDAFGANPPAEDRPAPARHQQPAPPPQASPRPAPSNGHTGSADPPGHGPGPGPGRAVDPAAADAAGPTRGRGLPERRRPVAAFPSAEEAARAAEKLDVLRSKVARAPRLAPGPQETRTAAPATAAATPAPQAAPVAPRPAPGAAASSPFKPVAPTAPSGPAPKIFPGFVVPSGTLGVRLTAYARWVSEIVGGADVFVIDTQGYPLVERGGDPDLMAAALLLGDAARRAANPPQAKLPPGDGLVHMDVGNQRVLSVIPCESVYGILCLGVHHRDPVGTQLAGTLAENLLLTLGR